MTTDDLKSFIREFMQDTGITDIIFPFEGKMVQASMSGDDVLLVEMTSDVGKHPLENPLNRIATALEALKTGQI